MLDSLLRIVYDPFSRSLMFSGLLEGYEYPMLSDEDFKLVEAASVEGAKISTQLEAIAMLFRRAEEERASRSH